MDRITQTLDCFNNGFNCAQAVLSVFAEQFGIEPATALRIATGFGGGIGRHGSVCGAVSGAVMVIGLKYGKVLPEDDEAREATYTRVAKLIEEFTARHGSINCKDILGCDISTPEGRAEINKNNLADTVCPDFLRSAIEITERLL